MEKILKIRGVVITGRLSSGKTTLVEEFESEGFRIVEEAARAIIDEGHARSMTDEEIRGDSFQQKIIERQIANESALPSDELVILDHGRPTSLAYCWGNGEDASLVFKAALAVNYYRVFILEPLAEIVMDGVRTDANIAAGFHPLIVGAYQYCSWRVGYAPPILVPVFSEDKDKNIRKRMRFIRERL